MPVPSTIADLSATAASNSPLGSESIGTNLDDYIRAQSAFIRQISDSDALKVGSSGAQTMAGPLSVTGGIVGTTTNDNASTGKIGEYLEASIASGAAVTPPSGSVIDVITLSLTAGDWDVDASISFNTAPSTTVSYWGGGINTASTTLPAYQHQVREVLYGQVPNTSTYTSPVMNLPTRRISLASTTTVYLIGAAGYAVSTLNCFGAIRARRVR